MIPDRLREPLWRFGALAFFCGTPLLLVGLAASNLVDASQASDQAARKAATTSAIVAQLEKHRARVVTPVDTASLYLTSASGTLARAEIQERATKLVADAGGRLVEVQLVGSPEQEADGTVAIQLSLDIDNKGLLELLYATESGLPLLDVTDVNVQKAQAEEGAADAGQLHVDQLHVDMTVRGHWRKATG